MWCWILTCVLAVAAPIPVEVVSTDTGPVLYRGGEPYTLNGVGGWHALDLLTEAGGTSIRTWGVGPETADLLDRAHERGLTVALGIWLGHTRHGFDYADPEQVAEHMQQGRSGVQAVRIAVQAPRDEEIDDETDHRHRHHRATEDLPGLGQALDGLGQDPERDHHQGTGVQGRAQHLGALIAHGLLAVGGPCRDPVRDQGHRQGADVREHMARVGKQGQRPGEHPADGLDHHIGGRQHQREAQRALLFSVVSVVVVVMAHHRQNYCHAAGRSIDNRDTYKVIPALCATDRGSRRPHPRGCGVESDRSHG